MSNKKFIQYPVKKCEISKIRRRPLVVSVHGRWVVVCMTNFSSSQQVFSAIIHRSMLTTGEPAHGIFRVSTCISMHITKVATTNKSFYSVQISLLIFRFRLY